MDLFPSPDALAPVTLPADVSVRLAAQRMREAAVGCVIVLDGSGEPCGLLTDRDLAVRVVAQGVDPRTLRVGDVMSSPLVTGRSDEGAAAWIDRMKRRGVRRLPLLDPEGLLVGIVSLDDLIEELAEEVAELGRETRAKVGKARRRAEIEHVRAEVDRRLGQAHDKLAYANWVTRDAILQQIDKLREALRRA